MIVSDLNLPMWSGGITHKIYSAIGYVTPDEFAKRWEKANPQEVANR